VQLAWHLEHLQRHIGPLIQEAACRDANILHQMQSFDHIGQKAMGLADFLAALAQAAPCQWLVDPAAAAQAVMLADLSSRLGLRVRNMNPAPPHGVSAIFSNVQACFDRGFA